MWIEYFVEKTLVNQIVFSYDSDVSGIVFTHSMQDIFSIVDQFYRTYSLGKWIFFAPSKSYWYLVKLCWKWINWILLLYFLNSTSLELNFTICNYISKAICLLLFSCIFFVCYWPSKSTKTDLSIWLAKMKTEYIKQPATFVWLEPDKFF